MHGLTFESPGKTQRAHSDIPGPESERASNSVPAAHGQHAFNQDAPRSTGTTYNDRIIRPPITLEKPADVAERAFQRAAEILCQSLNIDGVALLDASVSTFGGLSKAMDSTETSTGDSEDSANAPSQSDSAADEPRTSRREICKILGCAQTIRIATDEKHAHAKKLSETFLRNIMHRNPNGKIWTFDETGKEHSEDAFSSDDDETEIIATPKSESSQQRKAMRRVRRFYGESLQLIFPGVRTVALHGIYDHTRRRWSVGGIYWTYDALHVLSLETEMHFAAAFCDIIVAETSRLEVLGSDKAK